MRVQQRASPADLCGVGIAFAAAGVYFVLAGAGTLPLPVLRVRYHDEARTWVYVDPARGGVVRSNESTTRLRRWLYQGLHSLDFPGFYQAAWAWYPVMVLLGLGGTALSLTSVIVGWRYLRGKA